MMDALVQIRAYRQARIDKRVVCFMSRFVVLMLVGVLCSSCFNMAFGEYARTADFSSVEGVENVATIRAGTWRFECWIAEPGAAIRIIVDPGPIEILVVCDPQLTFSQFKQRFNFTAVAGHTYDVSYGLTECMRLKDNSIKEVIVDYCPP